MKIAERVQPIDEAITRESLRDWLTDTGYQVETAGEELALRAELSSWDEEGGVIAEQIITRFPPPFPILF